MKKLLSILLFVFALIILAMFMNKTYPSLFEPYVKNTPEIDINTPSNSPSLTPSVSPESSEKEQITPAPDISALPITPSPTKAPSPNLIEEAGYTGDSKQIITVTSKVFNTTYATLDAYEMINDRWANVYDNIPARIGYNGFSPDKVEGDKKSPAGIFSIGFMLGRADNPGVKFEYRKLDGDEYWVDDPDSLFYNTWQEGASNGRWKSSESLYNIWGYKYAAVINYNMPDIVPGKGSAIFLHVSSEKPTIGCTTIPEDDLLKILRWLDPEKKPVIVQGTKEYIVEMLK